MFASESRFFRTCKQTLTQHGLFKQNLKDELLTQLAQYKVSQTILDKPTEKPLRKRRLFSVKVSFKFDFVNI